MKNDKRTSDGKFAPGNGGGPGNPYARATARLRVVLLETITDEDIREIARVLIKRAKEGHLPAIQEVLNRLVGKPGEAPNPDTVDIEEMEQKRDREGNSFAALFSPKGNNG